MKDLAVVLVLAVILVALLLRISKEVSHENPPPPPKQTPAEPVDTAPCTAAWNYESCQSTCQASYKYVSGNPKNCLSSKMGTKKSCDNLDIVLGTWGDGSGYTTLFMVPFVNQKYKELAATVPDGQMKALNVTSPPGYPIPDFPGPKIVVIDGLFYSPRMQRRDMPMLYNEGNSQYDLRNLGLGLDSVVIQVRRSGANCSLLECQIRVGAAVSAWNVCTTVQAGSKTTIQCQLGDTDIEFLGNALAKHAINNDPTLQNMHLAVNVVFPSYGTVIKKFGIGTIEQGWMQLQDNLSFKFKTALREGLQFVKEEGFTIIRTPKTGLSWDFMSGEYPVTMRNKTLNLKS